jgi:Mg/Co/Ni transporter MgtE
MMKEGDIMMNFLEDVLTGSTVGAVLGTAIAVLCPVVGIPALAATIAVSATTAAATGTIVGGVAGAAGHIGDSSGSSD